MMRQHTLGLLLFLASRQGATAQPSASASFDNIKPSDDLAWEPCYENFTCAKLKAPLDYHQPDLGNAVIPLVKLPSSTKSTDADYKGLLLVNPGGFGLSGANFTIQNGAVVQSLVGPHWDIVGFDPRGIGFSSPSSTCGSAQTAQSKTSRSVPRLADRFYKDRIDQAAEIGEPCKNAIGGERDAGQHMPTATTVRDLLHIVNTFSKSTEGKNAPNQGRLLNFLGLSYATYLGQTFASMFPDRVGVMVLDAVADSVSVQNSFTENMIDHLDGVIASFFVYCHAAGPGKCVYHKGCNGAKAQSNAPFEEALLTLKVALFNLSYFPNANFLQLADILLSLEEALPSGKTEAWTEQTLASVDDSAGPSSQNVATLAMLCPEQGNQWYGQPLEAFEPLIAANEKQSIIGELMANLAVLGCSGWSINATEIYQGEFGAEKTKTPILFVSNTYDPVCPKENSHLALSRFKNAQRLLVDGLGHSLLAPANSCAFSKIQEYFQEGWMPEQDATCALEVGPFEVLLNGTVLENIREAGLTDLVGLL